MKKLLNTNNIKYYALSAVIASGFILNIIFTSSIKEQLLLAAKNVILNVLPSMLPMIFFSQLLINFDFPELIKIKSHRLVSLLLGLSGNSLALLIISSTGGYLFAGINSTILLNSKLINKSQAERIICFFTNPGISLCIFYAGKYLYNDISIGLIIYLSILISSIICCFVYNMKHKNKTEYIKNKFKPSFSDIFISSVRSSSDSIINIFVWILISSIIIQLLLIIFGKTFISDILRLFGEVTDSVSYFSEFLPLWVITFVLSNGGISIIIQLIPFLKKSQISVCKYVTANLIRSLISSLICLFLTNIFLKSEETFSVVQHFSIQSKSITGLITLIFFLVTFIFDFTESLQQNQKIL